MGQTSLITTGSSVISGEWVRRCNLLSIPIQIVVYDNTFSTKVENIAALIQMKLYYKTLQECIYAEYQAIESSDQILMITRLLPSEKRSYHLENEPKNVALPANEMMFVMLAGHLAGKHTYMYDQNLGLWFTYDWDNGYMNICDSRRPTIKGFTNMLTGDDVLLSSGKQEIGIILNSLR